MSDIKMCDQCHEIFSINEDGWVEYQQRISRPSSNGNTHKILHICPRHQVDAGNGRPRLAIEAMAVQQEEA